MREASFAIRRATTRRGSSNRAASRATPPGARRHANFIVNLGAARAADIEAVIAHVEATVREQTGVALQREVRIVGEAAPDARPGEPR